MTINLWKNLWTSLKSHQSKLVNRHWAHLHQVGKVHLAFHCQMAGLGIETGTTDQGHGHRRNDLEHLERNQEVLKDLDHLLNTDSIAGHLGHLPGGHTDVEVHLPTGEGVVHHRSTAAGVADHMTVDTEDLVAETQGASANEIDTRDITVNHPAEVDTTVVDRPLPINQDTNITATSILIATEIRRITTNQNIQNPVGRGGLSHRSMKVRVREEKGHLLVVGETSQVVKVRRVDL